MGTRCCNVVNDWVTVKKFDSNTGEFQWEILNIPNGLSTDNDHLNITAIDSYRYLYVNYAEYADIDTYESEWGNLSYPNVSVASNSGERNNFRYYLTVDGGYVEPALHFQDGQQTVVEEGVYKIDLQTGDTLEKIPLIFYTNVLQEGEESFLREQYVSYKYLPTGDQCAGNYFFADRKNLGSDRFNEGLYHGEDDVEFVTGINAANPNYKTKKYVLAFNQYARNIDTPITIPDNPSEWIFTAPELSDHGLPQQTVTIYNTYTKTQIEQAFSVLPHIDSVSVSGDLRSGSYIMEITWIHLDVINFESVVKSSPTSAGNAIFNRYASLKIPDIKLVDLSTGLTSVYYQQNFPDTDELDSTNRDFGRLNFSSRAVVSYKLLTCSSGERLIASHNFNEYFMCVDSFILDGEITVSLDWGKNIELSPVLWDHYAPVWDFKYKGHSFRPAFSVDVNDDYLSLFFPTLAVWNPFGFVPDESESGYVINISDGSTLYTDDNGVVCNQHITQLVGNTSNVIRQIQLINAPDSGNYHRLTSPIWDTTLNSFTLIEDNGSGGANIVRETNLSQFVRPIHELNNWGATRDTGWSASVFCLLSDLTTFMFAGGTKEAAGPFIDTVISEPFQNFYYVDTPPDYTENLITSRETALIQETGYTKVAGSPDGTRSYKVNIIFPWNVYMNTNCRFRLYASNNGNQTENYSDWFGNNFNMTQIQSFLDYVFGFNTADPILSHSGERNARLDNDDNQTIITGRDINGITANFNHFNAKPGEAENRYVGFGGFEITFFVNTRRNDLWNYTDPFFIGRLGNGDDLLGIEYETNLVQRAKVVKSSFYNPDNGIEWSRNCAISSYYTGDNIVIGSPTFLKDDTFISVFKQRANDGPHPYSEGEFDKRNGFYAYALPNTLNTSDYIYNA
jgi:hypothetical protein